MDELDNARYTASKVQIEDHVHASSSPGHSQVFNVAHSNIENMGVAWGQG